MKKDKEGIYTKGTGLKKKMNTRERIGYTWLVDIMGYDHDEIFFEARTSPDFLTNDGIGWEVKSKFLTFTFNQLMYLHWHTVILIVKDLEVIPIPLYVLLQCLKRLTSKFLKRDEDLEWNAYSILEEIDEKERTAANLVMNTFDLEIKNKVISPCPFDYTHYDFYSAKKAMQFEHPEIQLFIPLTEN